MKKGLIFIGVFALFLIPLVSFGAEGGFFGSIFPDALTQKLNAEEDGGPASLGACDLVSLFDSAVRFAVYLSILVATLMFTYAGFLYVTASANKGNYDSARKIFSNVFLGLVFILGAWLIVNAIMSVLVPQDNLKLPWNRIDCVQQATGSTSFDKPKLTVGDKNSVVLPGTDTRTLEQKIADEKTARDNLCLRSYTGNKDGEVFCALGVNKEMCGVNQAFNDPALAGAGCTDVSRLKETTKEYAIDVTEDCNCNLTITGGSELGHSEKGVYNHGNGDAVDFRSDAVIDSFVIDNSKRFKRSGSTDGNPRYIDTKTGAVWVKEPDHWHVCTNAQCSAQ